MTRLYHYTTAAGIKGIVAEQNFRATHFRFLNDYKEGAVLNEKISFSYKKALLAYIEKHRDQFKLDQINNTYGSVEALADREATGFFHALFGTHNRLAPTFVLSLCQHETEQDKSNGLLSQWRAYGRDGGYCLVLDQEKCETLLKEQAAKINTCSIASGTVDYVDDPTDDHVAPFDEAFKKLIPALMNKTDTREMLLSTLYDPLVRKVPFVKDGSFREEREYRVVVSVFDKKAVAPPAAPIAIQFNDRNGTLVPFINIFQEQVQLPIERVIVGPSLHSERRRRSIELFLHVHGVEADVTISGIPFSN